MFGLELDLSWVFELDSSTPAKFSRHLIINIPGKAFSSNIHAGCLVARALDLAAAQAEVLPALQLLINQVHKIALPWPSQHAPKDAYISSACKALI